MTNRMDWVLLLLALRDANEPLDPVRIQSGMFIVSHDAGLPANARYDFEALDSGPFSAAVASDVEKLEDMGFVARHGVSGYTWSEFAATERGIEQAEQVMSAMSRAELGALRTLAAAKVGVLRCGFRDLMEHLVRSYPAPPPALTFVLR